MTLGIELRASRHALNMRLSGPLTAMAWSWIRFASQRKRHIEYKAVIGFVPLKIATIYNYIHLFNRHFAKDKQFEIVPSLSADDLG
jgi:glyoxylate carboligase